MNNGWLTRPRPALCCCVPQVEPVPGGGDERGGGRVRHGGHRPQAGAGASEPREQRGRTQQDAHIPHPDGQPAAAQRGQEGPGKRHRHWVWVCVWGAGVLG